MEKGSATVQDWQDGKCSAECSRYMLEQQIGCDVTFLVGGKRQEVRAHKFILISRSPVFEAMFCGPLAETQAAIPIPDIEPETFQLLLRYMYYDADNLDTDSLRVLYAAKKYCVSKLAKICRDDLSKMINTENACQLLQQAHTLDEPPLVQTCLSFVLSNGEVCLKSEGLGTLSRECFKQVIEADDLMADEITVWDALIKWAHAACKRQQEDVTTATLREALGDMLYSVRLSGISADDFAKHVSASGVLSKDEVISIFNFYHGACKRLTEFSMKTGRPYHRYQRCYRFQSASALQGLSQIETQCHLSFYVSAPIALCGIMLYKCRTSAQRYVISGQLMDDGGRVRNGINTSVDTRPGGETFDVMFCKKAQLRENELFTLNVNVSGSFEYGGYDEQNQVTVGDITFEFLNQQPSLQYGWGDAFMLDRAHINGRRVNQTLDGVSGPQIISGLIFKTLDEPTSSKRTPRFVPPELLNRDILMQPFRVVNRVPPTGQ